MANTRLPHHRLLHWWQHRLAVAALLLLTLTLGYLAWQFNLVSDQTHNRRNTLSPASLKVLQQLPDPIEVTAFCSNSPYKGRYFRKAITTLIQRYQSAHGDLQLQFVDPVSDPAQARAQQIKKEGEMLIRYHGRQQHLYLPYTEEAFTNVLLQLQHGERAPVLFASGQGEPALDDPSAQGMSHLAHGLASAGLTVGNTDLQTLATGRTDQHKQATLVLAGATQAYSPPQRAQIMQHVQNGGSLLWLVDSPQAQGLQALVEQFGLAISPGLLIDPANRQYDIAPHQISSQRYASQGPTQDFALRTFFNGAHAIQRQRPIDKAWKITPLVAAADHGWSSARYTAQQPATIPPFDNAHDHAGPATIALGLERTLTSGAHQRIVLIASQRFLTNTELQRGGNQALAMQCLQWLVNTQPSIQLPVTPLRDSVILLPQNSQQQWLLMLTFNSFQFGMPLLLAAAGWLAWRRKRH